MAQLCEASILLKRLSERLYQQNNCEQQSNIDSLQQILDSPLFNTLYNLQESFQQLKFEFEKGNQLIKNCSFDFDIEGHLKLIKEQITKQNIENNRRLSNDNIVRKIVLNKRTSNESLGFSIVACKHRLFDINAIFIQNITPNSLADINGQLHTGDQLVCINNIYLDSKDSTVAVRAHQLLDSTQLSIELVVIATTNDYSHAAVSKSNNDGHSCVPTLSTPFHVDMVLNTLWTQIEVVELINDGSGLGFGITGNKSTGVVVKAIVPGSIADKDGRIRTGDHLFQINHVCVRGMSSEQVAGILRQCPQQVRLVVARSVREPTTTDTTTSIPSVMSQRTSLTSETLFKTTNNIDPSSATLSSPMPDDNDGIINSSQNKILLRTERLLENNHNFEKLLENLREQGQHEDGTELLDVTLEKGDDGLGITVAGYVSPDSTNNDAIAGIFIRDIAEGSVCARDGRLAIGDQIIEVNDQSLNGFSNVQALYLLQNTSSSVRLKVRRYLDGFKYEKIKDMITLEASHQIEEKLEYQPKLSINEQITQKWTKILGNNYDILIADVYKPDNGGLGITLEGTVDIENGEEVRPHHYIRALLRDGPIGTEGTLKSGDELLEVNNQILYGKNHIHVIEILKRVKHQVKIVCARRKTSQINETNILNNIPNHHNRSRSISFGKTAEIVVKAKSLGTLDSTNLSINLLSSSPRITKQFKSRSLEVISNLALWSTSIINIELYKSDNGLGFSVLDYQDPSNPSFSPVIVIRALVPGGVAQLDGRIVPGDRLVAVNDITLENMNLDDVIKILKSTPKGLVKLSLSKPLPYPKFKNDTDDKITTDSDQEINNINNNNNNQINQRSSRISKSKTTTEIINNHQRSVSSHRSSTTKQPAVSAGIALSAPAILSKHEYIESLLNKEKMSKKPEQRTASANRTNRREKRPSPRTFSLEKNQSEKDKIRQLNTEEYLDLLPRKKSQTTVRKLSTNTILNLPEFKYFQSDHLVLIPQIASYPFYDRLRGSSAFTATKFNRQSATNNSNNNNNNNIISQTTTTTVISSGSPRTSHSSSTKRLSRSRQTYDTTINHEQQQQQQQTHIMRPSSLRQMTNKFDAITCFHEPDLSSDDDHNNNNNNNNNCNVVRSSSSSSSPLTHRQSIKNVVCPTTTATSIIDEDAHEVDAIIKQHQRILTDNNNENNSVITPTIKTPTTPTITSKWTSSRQSSRMASPALSTSSQSSGRVITFLNHEVIQLPAYLEREIRVKHHFDQLGLVVDAYVDEGVNGCFIRSITPPTTGANQYVLRPGDYLLSINNESMKKISNAQARSIIRRASLIGSDISVVFIPGDEAKQFKDHTLDAQPTSSPVTPEIVDSDMEPSSIKPVTTTTVKDDSDSYGFDSHNNPQQYSTVIDSETLSATLWGSPRTVILYRNEHVKSLGISIVGGKLDFSGPGNTIESCISGIFIKHVLPDSPAGRNGTLKTGDRILEVNGYDLRDASHDRAVEIIRAAQSPVHFIVQSLLDPSNPTSSTNDNSSTNFSHIPNSPLQNKILSTPKSSLINERKTEDELIKQYGHLNGDLLYIDIKRNLAEINEPLGLSLIGHRDPNKLAVFVCDIQPGSLLDRDNRIRPGDQLLEVNGEILLGKAHSTVTPIIKSIKADTLNFVVLRNPNAINDMALNNQHAAAARLRASAMTSTSAHFTSTSPKLVRSQLSPSSFQHPSEQQMTNDASYHHHHHVHVPKHQPDVNEYKENDDRLTSTSVFPPSMYTFDETEHIQNKNGRKASIPQTTTTRDEKLSVTKEMPTSSTLSSNRITTTTADVQRDNNDVSSLNHNISSSATITASHSLSSDVSSPTHRFTPSSFDQQSNAYGNDESLPRLQQPSSTTTSSSLLMHDQANHANDKYLENKTPTNNDILTKNNQTLTSPQHTPNEKSKNIISPTYSSSIIQSNELQKQNNNSLPSDVIISSPSKQKKEDNLSDIKTIPTKTTANGAVVSHIPIMSSSSSSSSSLSVSTPSSVEHTTRKQVPLSSTQVLRRASISAPGAPITLILNKDQKGLFGLTLTQYDNAIWVQSVQPHGPADQQDIRAGDQLIQINGTPVEALKFSDIQNMLEHANSNQIHLTCVPYREPQAQPVVININQAESLPTLMSNDADVNKEDDPRTRPIIVGQETLIEIDRGQSGLGLSVVGGSDTQLSAIIIHDIYDGCAAQYDGRLLVGDQILEVNSIDLRSATHEEAIQALRQATNVVRILVLRGKMLTEMMNEQDKFDIITIDLIKKSGKGLGFSIIGRRHGYGVFISHILEGGCAEKDGRLMSGDLILEVNGQDLRTAAYEHVAYTLKTLPHGRVNIKIGRLKPSARAQNRQSSASNDRKNRSRSSSSNLRRSSANKIIDR